MKEVNKKIKEYEELNSLQNYMNGTNTNWNDKLEHKVGLVNFINKESINIFPISSEEELDNLK